MEGVIFLGNNVTADISLETIKARRKWNDIFEMLKGIKERWRDYPI